MAGGKKIHILCTCLQQSHQTGSTHGATHSQKGGSLFSALRLLLAFLSAVEGDLVTSPSVRGRSQVPATQTQEYEGELHPSHTSRARGEWARRGGLQRSSWGSCPSV